MLHLAAYRRLEIFDMPFPVNRLVRDPGEGPRTAVHTVINAGKVGVASHFRPFLDAQIGGITINDLVILADQIGCLCNIMCVRGCDSYGMHKTTVCIHTYMTFHPKPPLIPLLCLVHLWITGLLCVLRGTGGVDDRCIYDHAAFQHVSGFHHHAIDYFKKQFVQSMCSTHKEPFRNLVGNRMMP